MNKKFDLEEFTTDCDVTHIELKDSDIVYIQLPEPDPSDKRPKEEIRREAHSFFAYLFEDFNVKLGVEHLPLNITVITKKEEFVARLGDKVVQL